MLSNDCTRLWNTQPNRIMSIPVQVSTKKPPLNIRTSVISLFFIKLESLIFGALINWKQVME